MKITQEKRGFRAVTLVLETPEEWAALYSAVVQCCSLDVNNNALVGTPEDFREGVKQELPIMHKAVVDIQKEMP